LLLPLAVQRLSQALLEAHGSFFTQSLQAWSFALSKSAT
jgi:hypothetical protein